MTSMWGTIVPIIFFLLFGVFCRKKQFISSEAITGMKRISVDFLLPIVLFYAFFTADYGKETLYYAVVTFVPLTITFLIAQVLKKHMKSPMRACLPYLSAGSELGMLGYALLTLMLGPGGASQLALYDVGHSFYFFPICLLMLNIEQGEGDVKETLIGVIKSPLIILFVLGMISGFSGIAPAVMDSQAGDVIRSIYTIVSNANIVIILTVMGYGIDFSVHQLKEAIPFVLFRMAFMTVFCCLGLWFLNITIGLNDYSKFGLITVFIMPPVYMLSVATREEERSRFMTTATSIYTLLSLGAFIVMIILAG